MSLTNSEIVFIVAILIVFIVVMIFFIIVILFFVQKKQKGFVSDLSSVKANYEKELFKAQMEIQEHTFRDISSEIHDNVAQTLSLAKLGIGSLELEKKGRLEAGLSEISDILEKALYDLRNLSHLLSSETIASSGLKKSIEMQLGYIQRGGRYKTDLIQLGDAVSLDKTKETILFRIVQEAINNILKHATAGEINVSLSYEVKFLKLEIKDNGKGFDLQSHLVNAGQVNGLHNMERRTRLIDGHFELDSKIGEGTIITITTPY